MAVNQVLHYGMGCDSSALLTSYLTDSDSPFKDLNIRTVVMSQTGNESQLIKEQVEQCIFPLLRLHKIRTVQTARRGSSTGDGFVVLDDTDCPEICYIVPTSEKPYYSLGDDQLLHATVPQFASGRRKCSDKFKIKILDSWHNLNCPGCEKIIGFDADEENRICRATVQQNGHPTIYPLYKCGWNRERITDYLESVYGRKFYRSACYFCPFSAISGGATEMREKFDLVPEEGAMAAYLEYVSVCFNTRQSLSGGKTLVERKLLNEDALFLYEQKLESVTWKVFKVRRITKTGSLKIPYRSIQALAVGTRTEMGNTLLELAGKSVGTWMVCDRGISRFHLESPQGCDEFLVCTPGNPLDKHERPQFENMWAEATGTIKQLSLFEV